MSRSQLIRDAITDYLRAGADREAAVADQYADAYTKFPLDTPDAWGDLDSWHAGLERPRGEDRRRPRMVIDTPELVPRSLFTEQLATLSPVRMVQVCRALREAVHCTDLGW